MAPPRARVALGIACLLLLATPASATAQGVGGAVGSRAQHSPAHVDSVHTIAPANLDELRAFFHYREGAPPLLVAHRGGRGNAAWPENSLELFDHVLRRTHAIIETDFVLTADGEVVMLHDDTLDRTTTGSGKVVDQTLAQIRRLALKSSDGVVTGYHTRSLAEVLAWAKGRTILAVDVKAPLTFERMVKEIVAAGAEGRVFVQTYNLEDARLVHRLHPRLMMSTSIRTEADLDAVRDAGIPLANIIAHTGAQEPADLALYGVLRRAGIYTMVGTLGRLDRAATGDPDVYRSLLRNGATIISTDRPLEAADAIRGMVDSASFRRAPFGNGRRH